MHVVRTGLTSLFAVTYILNNTADLFQTHSTNFCLLSLRVKHQQHNRSWSAGPKNLQTRGTRILYYYSEHVPVKE